MSVDIAAENARAGWSPQYTWYPGGGAGDLNNVGFARRMSVNVGETVEFCCHGTGTRIDIFRLGWYQGLGARMVDQIVNTPTVQPEATEIPDSNGATTCTNWTVTCTWDVPADAASGMYVAVFHNVPLADKTWMPFVVRDDDAHADIIYKTSESTWGMAYNYYGTPAAPTSGKNLYGTHTAVGNILDRSYAVSSHRPVITRESCTQTYLLACEYPLIRWLERNGFSIKYVTCADLDVRGVDLLRSGSVFISSGHDEYWSGPMRDAVESWRDDHAGRSIFLSGNEVFWKTRYQHVPSTGESIMWCHKDTMPGPNGTDHVPGAPLDPVEWTGTWKDTRWSKRRPEWLLTGTDFRMNGVYDHDATIVRSPYAGHKVWGGTSLNDGDITLSRVIGFEADSARPTQPSESVRLLAAYTRDISGAYANDDGQDYSGRGQLEWGIVAQRYSGGGLTVGFGTCQWAWALDDLHDRGGGTAVSADAQQFTLNLLRDLGATPHTPQESLTLQPLNSLDDYGLEPGDDTPSALTAVYDGLGQPVRVYDGLGQPVTFSARPI